MNLGSLFSGEAFEARDGIMQQARQRQLTQQLFRLIDGETTDMAPSSYANTVDTYTDPGQMRREVDELFLKRPLNLALTADLPNPGDCLAVDHLPVPVLLTRDRDGKVHAFFNVCRHRGAQLIQGRVSGKRSIACPYHAWGYGLDGSLRAVPFEAGFEDCKRDSMGLRTLPVAERDGLIWVVPTAGAEIDLDAMLGSLQGDIASYGFQDFVHFETRQISVAMNWKLVVDTFLESYHISYLHKPSIHPIIQSNRALFEDHGEHLLTVYPRWSFNEQPREAPEDWDFIKHTVMVYILFPNTVLIVQGDHLEFFRVYPEKGNPDRSVMDVALYTPEPIVTDSARRHWQNNMDLLIRVVCTEDFPLGETIQHSFHSGAQDAVTFGRNEPALQHYHQTIRKSLNLPHGNQSDAVAAE